MKPLFSFLLFMIAASPALLAQRENNIWCFGRHKSLDFNGTTPVLGTSKLDVFESSASVCDRSGSLLFYMGSDTVWNRNHQAMPNGTAMLGNSMGSAYRGVGIVQFPADTSKYYLFVTDAVELHHFDAYYSVIDMNLNGGLGDVVPGQKNIRLDTNIVEGVCLLPMSDCKGYWVALHKRGSTEFHAYSIDAGGLSTSPVISQGILASSAGIYNGYSFRANNSGNRIAAVGTTKIELGSFDQATGMFSGFHVVDTAMYYPTFSPDDTKLYMSNGAGLHQLDVSLLPNTAAVLGSLSLIDTGHYAGSRLGPDQQLYVIRPNFFSVGTAIARIQNPNAIATAINLQRNFIPAFYGLPFEELGSAAAVLPPGITYYSSKDTIVCNATSVTLTGDPTYRDIRWSTGGTTQQEVFSEPGTYWLQGWKQCNRYIDTFRVSFRNLAQPLLGPDTSICPGDTLTLIPSAMATSYQWQDGSTGPIFSVSQAGTYQLTAFVPPCTYRDTIHITLIAPFAGILQPGTTICAGYRLLLEAKAAPGSELLWSTGEQGSTIAVTESGSYTLTATNACGVFRDSVQVTAENCICKPFVPNAFSPNGDGKNDKLRVFLNCPGTREYQFQVYNRYGQRVFRSTQPGDEWDGSFNGKGSDTGTYFYYLQYKDTEGQMIKKKGDIILIH
ncbi:gliding motility-associated C-terminal domain-containing protein [Taibaiella koreensis]|uniref:gliding motility-associated C-terminal domain-containing protein n=1 Tax=Taibaiella koreensis TaxID=1268548 RepID=UPI000E59D544|nr:gliding motility-associated C-terminal domain-containing protein [Taibaiella koreensis]